MSTARKTIIAILALTALVTAIFTLSLVVQFESDVEKLLRVVESGNDADAVWALTVLSELPDRKFQALVPLVTNETPTVRRELVIVKPPESRRGGWAITSRTPYRLGNAAQFLLLCRLALRDESLEREMKSIGGWSADLETRWRSIWRERAREVRENTSGEHGTDPPSQRPEFFGIESRPERWVEALTDGSAADAEWAQETAKGFSDGQLGALLPWVDSEEATRIRYVRSPGVGPSRAVSVGEVVRYPLASRIAKVTRRPETAQELRHASPAELRQAWKERMGGQAHAITGIRESSGSP